MYWLYLYRLQHSDGYLSSVNSPNITIQFWWNGLLLFFFFFYNKVDPHDTCLFLLNVQPNNRNSEFYIFIPFPVLVTSCATVWGVCWIVKNSCKGFCPKEPHQINVNISTKWLLRRILLSQLGHFQTHISLLPFTDIAAPMYLAWQSFFLSEARVDDHCIFRAWGNMFDCQLQGPGNITLTSHKNTV